LFGIIGKFSAIILTIPDCVLGGMTTFVSCADTACNWSSSAG
jgi:xanthine/uracil permease